MATNTGTPRNRGTIQLVTLGCSKNLVDSEYLLRQLDSNGFRPVHADSPVESRCAIINTCGFIHDAKKESIETILEFLQEKKKGKIGQVFVMGCLSERYKEQLKQELPEVDGFFGLNESRKILRSLGSSYREDLVGERLLTTPSHYAYLKISEGCDRQCAFCAIPLIRGRQRSVPIEMLVQEAGRLAAKGVKELLLIAQDLTAYGTDIYGERRLPALLAELAGIEGIEWIRMHYTYPARFPVEEIIQLMKDQPKICRYLDMPVQHIDPFILRAMHRGHGPGEIRHIIDRFREEIPEISLRTTLITGFPGEGKAEYLALKRFVQETRFDRLGIFPYSHEEQTPAWKAGGDTVPERTRKRRMETLLEIQEAISTEKNRSRVGSVIKVLIDGREGRYYYGRTEADSPEVDQEVLIPVKGNAPVIGDFCSVRITGSGAFELFGEVVAG